MLLVYCEICGFRIAPDELKNGLAREIDENRYQCAKCSSAAKVPATPVSEVRTERPPSAAHPTKPMRETPASSPQQRLNTPSAELRAYSGGESSKPTSVMRKGVREPVKKQGGLPVPVMAGAGAAALLLIVVLMWPSKKPSENVVAQGENKTETKVPKEAEKIALTTVAVVTPPHQPNATTGGAQAERNLPSWMQKETRAVESGPRRPSNEHQRDEGDSTIFFDDALPPKAEELGTANVRFISWRWVPKDKGPVFSGDYSHTVASDPTEKLHQHYFEGANPPLAITGQDVFFTYVYIDPAQPPKTLMLQWRDDSWEHRAYWGERKIEFGQDNTASCRPMGPLPKAGEWIRLEVPAAAVGFDKTAHSITGCSFDHFGGRVYFDKVGVQRKAPKPAAAATSPSPVPPSPGSKAPPGGQVSVGKVLWNALNGGQEFHNFWNKQKSSRAIWAKTTPLNHFVAKYSASGEKYGAGTLAITSLRQTRKEACRLILEINGKIVFDGVDPATGWEWAEHHFPIPDGVVKAGNNEVRILNAEEKGNHGQEPWYMVHSVELFATPAK